MANEDRLSDDNSVHLHVKPLSGVDIGEAHLQTRGDVSQDNVFEILPKFIVSSDLIVEERTKEFYVHAATGGSDVSGIAIGAELIIFGRDKENPVKQLRFPASIDFVVWRRSILLIGLSSSKIMLLDTGSYEIKHSWTLGPDVEGNGDSPFFVDAFVHSNPDPTKLDVIVVSTSGIIYRFPDTPLSVGSLDSTQDQNLSLDIDFGLMSEDSHKLEICSQVVCVASPTRNRLVVVEKAGRIQVVNFDQSDLSVTPEIMYIPLSIEKSKPVTVKKITVFDGLVFVLLSDGKLQILLGRRMSRCELFSPSLPVMFVHDFALVRNNYGNVKLWTLHELGTESNKQNYVGIFEGPDFCSEFLFKLPELSPTTRDHCGSSYEFSRSVGPMEEPMLIVETCKNTVTLFEILETSTDITLEKLLSRRKYSEAHLLAVNFKKDLDIVRKAQARDLLNEITSHDSKQSTPDNLYQRLIDVLKSIGDAEFVCSFCVHASLPKIEWVKEILMVGRGRVSSCFATDAAKTLLLNIKKFYTFELIFPSGNISDWNALNADDNTMFLQSTKFLKMNKFDACEKVWQRHVEEFIETITLADFLPFFSGLFSHHLQTPASVSLLITILPFAVTKIAQSNSDLDNPNSQQNPSNVGVQELHVLINVILRQVKSLESRTEWPTNALTFILKLIKIMKDQLSNYETSGGILSDITLQGKKQIVQRLYSQLQHYEEILLELAELKTKHSITIGYEKFANKNKTEVINYLLSQLLSKEEVESFVVGFLRPYCKRMRYDLDSIFKEHIEATMNDIPFLSQAITIAGEERIICLVNLTTNLITKLESASLISQEWPVPWTNGISNLINQILDRYNQHSEMDPTCLKLLESIQLMKKQVPYRCVLNKYKFSGTTLFRGKSNLMMAIMKVLQLKKPDYIEDCKELLRSGLANNFLEDMDSYIEYVDTCLKMYNADIDSADVLPNVGTNLKLRKALIHRFFLELTHLEDNEQFSIYDKNEQTRFVDLYNEVASESSNFMIATFAKLKRFCFETKFEAICHPEFPLSVIIDIFEHLNHTTFSGLLSDCKQLGRITQAYVPDLLLATAICLFRRSYSGKLDNVVWDIVECIVKNPIKIDINNTFSNQHILQYTCWNIILVLMQQCPELSLEQMNTLHEFLCIVGATFNEFAERIAHTLCFFRILWTLKEQEIPLEREFVEIFQWSNHVGVDWEKVGLASKLITIGEILLSFGGIETFNSIFKSLKRHFHEMPCSFGDLGNPFFFKQALKIIVDVEMDLSQRAKCFIVESTNNIKLNKLVKDLNDAGVKVNAYSLGQRDRSKLLNRLVKMENYKLAAELAIHFKLDKPENWEDLLPALITSGNMHELREILKGIKDFTNLWMMPQFIAAWKEAAEGDKKFLELFPMGLD